MNTESDKLHKIGDVAKSLGVSVRTIRFYEELGLVHPHRTDGGTRLYAKKDIARLKTVVALTEHDVRLDRITEVATTRQRYSTGRQSSAALAPILKELLAHATKKAASFQELAGDIDRALLLIAQCSDCANEASTQGCPDCPVGRSGDRSRIAQLLWDDTSN